MREVALLRVTDVSYDYDSYSKHIPYHISEWTKITDEDYKELVESMKWVGYTGEDRLVLIEKPDHKETVQLILDKARAYRAEQLKREQEAQKKKEAAAKKKALTSKKSKEALFNKLKKELGKE